MFKKTPWSSVEQVKQDGDRTEYTVKFGCVKSCSFGDSIPSKPVTTGVGGDAVKWKAVFFPKGFTDPDYASLYICSVDCDMDEGDDSNPDRITSSAFATVNIFMQPKPPPLPPPKKKKEEDDDDDGDDDDDDDAASSVASAMTPEPVSTKAGSKEGKDPKKSGGSQRAASNRGDVVAAEGVVAEDGGEAGGVLPPPIEKELSQLFTNKAPSWGFEKLFDMGKMYNYRAGYLLGWGEDKPETMNPENLQNGCIEIKVTIFAATGFKLYTPEIDPLLQSTGRQRVYWTIGNIRRLIEKVGPKKRISSDLFLCADGEWYLDLYPNGFQSDKTEPPTGRMSLYLHSSRRQVELGAVNKAYFKFGLKKLNPAEAEEEKKLEKEEEKKNKKEGGGKKAEGDAAKGDAAKGDAAKTKAKAAVYDDVYFPPNSSAVSIFTPSRKCFGKNHAYDQDLLTKGRVYPPGSGQTFDKEFILGKYMQKGAVVFVLDILECDKETWQVQHMVHEIEEFGVKQNICADTQQNLGSGDKVICYHCGKAFCKEVTNYQARMEEYGYEIGREYITDILMREEEHWLDRVLKEINIPDKVDLALKSFAAKMARIRMTKEEMEEEEEAEEEEEELDPDDPNLDPLIKKKLNKEKAEQKKFEDRIKALRLDVEDSHFSKPVCSKCAEKRKQLQGCKVIYANEPDITRGWRCPDQNARETVLPDGTSEYVPMTAKGKKNFRKGWRDTEKLMGEKYQAMSKAMSVINIVDECVLQTYDWITKKLPPATPALPQLDAKGRSAMTLVRGNIMAEPMELTVQCNGRVNAEGISPEEDEDEPRTNFCDVRFDVKKPPTRKYCLFTGKLFCDSCAKYKVPLPQFENLYDEEAKDKFENLYDEQAKDKVTARQARIGAPEPVFKDPSEILRQVCYDAKIKMGATVQRIQPESKMPEEEVVAKRPGAMPEEEEDDVDIFAFLLKIPCVGKPIHEKLDELVNAP